MRSPLGGGVMAAIHAASRPAFIPPSAPPYVTSPAPVTYVSPPASVNFVTSPAPSTTTTSKPDAMTLMANMLGQVLAQVNRLERNQPSHQNSRPNAYGGTRYGSTSGARNGITSGTPSGSSDGTRNGGSGNSNSGGDASSVFRTEQRSGSSSASGTNDRTVTTGANSVPLAPRVRFSDSATGSASSFEQNRGRRVAHDECRFCGLQGHFWRDCPTRLEQESANASGNGPASLTGRGHGAN